MYQQEQISQVRELTEELGHLTDALNAVVEGNAKGVIQITYNGTERVSVEMDDEEAAALIVDRIDGIAEELGEIATAADDGMEGYVCNVPGCTCSYARGGF
jgi:hypothetical protein